MIADLPEPAPDGGSAAAQSARRQGKVARLPRDIREQVNTMLADGRPYAAIITWLDGNGHPGVTESNISNWFAGGHKEWLREQSVIAGMRRKQEWAERVVRENKGSSVHAAASQLAASQLFEVLDDFDPANLKALLEVAPENYAKVVNSLAKLGDSALKMEKYQDACERGRAELQKLRDPKSALNETERTAVIDKVDEILGLK